MREGAIASNGMGTPQLQRPRAATEDAWGSRTRCISLCRCFQSYLVGMMVAQTGNQPSKRAEQFSGFLVDINGHLWWLTAGHVIPVIRNLLMSSLDGRCSASWLECSGQVYFDITITPLFCAPDREPDVGAVPIRGITEKAIRASPETRAFPLEALLAGTRGQPREMLGRYLLGLPDEWAGPIESAVLPDGKVLRSRRFDRSLLPVVRLDHSELPDDVRVEVWKDPESIYGQIMPFSDTDDAQPDSLQGMSGGPLLEVYEVQEGLALYPIGVCSSRIQGKRLIRAEPSQRVAEVLLQWDRSFHEPLQQRLP